MNLLLWSENIYKSLTFHACLHLFFCLNILTTILNHGVNPLDQINDFLLVPPVLCDDRLIDWSEKSDLRADRRGMGKIKYLGGQVIATSA